MSFIVLSIGIKWIKCTLVIHSSVVVQVVLEQRPKVLTWQSLIIIQVGPSLALEYIVVIPQLLRLIKRNTMELLDTTQLHNSSLLVGVRKSFVKFACFEIASGMIFTSNNNWIFYNFSCCASCYLFSQYHYHCKQVDIIISKNQALQISTYNHYL